MIGKQDVGPTGGCLNTPPHCLSCQDCIISHLPCSILVLFLASFQTIPAVRDETFVIQ